MPVYEYCCQDCGERFDRAESMSEHEKAPPRCPTCGSEHVEPQLSAFFAKTGKKS